MCLFPPLLLWFGKPDGPCNPSRLEAACKSQAHKNIQGAGAAEPWESSPSRLSLILLVGVFRQVLAKLTAQSEKSYRPISRHDLPTA